MGYYNNKQSMALPSTIDADSPTEPQAELLKRFNEALSVEAELALTFNAPLAVMETTEIFGAIGVTPQVYESLDWGYFRAGSATNPLVFSEGLQCSFISEQADCLYAVNAYSTLDLDNPPGVYTTLKIAVCDPMAHVHYVKISAIKTPEREQVSTIIEFGTKETIHEAPIGTVILTLLPGQEPKIIHKQAQITPPEGKSCTIDTIPSTEIRTLCEQILGGENPYEVVAGRYLMSTSH